MSVVVKAKMTIEDTLGVEYRVLHFSHSTRTCQVPVPPDTNGVYARGKCWRPRGHTGPHAKMGDYKHELYRWFCDGEVYSRLMLDRLRKERGITEVVVIRETTR